MKLPRIALAIAFILSAGPVLAHGDHGLVPGLLHMFAGLEHWPFALGTVVSALLAVRQTGAPRWVFGGLAAAGGVLTFAL